VVPPATVCRVWFAYVDESFDAREYWAAAVLLDHTRVDAAAAALRRVVADAAHAYAIPGNAELHAYEIFQGVGDWAAMAGLHRARIGVYAKAFRALMTADPRIIVRGVDRGGLARRYGEARIAHDVVMGHLIERIDECCDATGSHGLVIADEHERAAALLRDLERFKATGTTGYRGRRVTRIVDTIHFVSSRTNPLCQAADLVAFLERRRRTVVSPNPLEIRANSSLRQIIAPAVEHAWLWHP